MKKWKTILMTGTLLIGLLGQPLAAAASGTTATVIKNGSFHVEQFGEYEIDVTVEVKEEKISDLEVTGSQFGGSYASFNQEKLALAASGMKKQLIGLSAADAEAIQAVDSVSGATVSCNGIKKALFRALNLTEEKETGGALTSALEAGHYEVLVSVRSDVIDHSLVEQDTARAQVIVDANGKMQLTYRMISGTKKEPMYILAFHGYYPENDRNRALSMEGAAVEMEKKGDYTVAGNVTIPLADGSGTYFTNTTIYVPAMQNLNGTVAGIFFENGTFRVDNIITVDWDTLQKMSSSGTGNNGNENTGTGNNGTGSGSGENNSNNSGENNSNNSGENNSNTSGENGKDTSGMEITATVQKQQDAPLYSVVIPETLPLGTIRKTVDYQKTYQITVRTDDKNGTITVSAPNGGDLKNGNHRLPFQNDFGKQVFEANETSTQKHLSGRIYIAATDVQKVPVGHYSGTTTFTIQYTEQNNGSDSKPGTGSDSGSDSKPGNESDSGSDSKPGTGSDSGNDSKPGTGSDSGSDSKPGTGSDSGSDSKPEFDWKNLEDGVYSITGKMVKIDKKTASMADRAVNHTIKLTVKDGVYKITLDFSGLDIGGRYGYLGELSYYLDGYTQNNYGVIQGSLQGTTVDAYQTNSDGSKLSDSYGTDYPKKVTLPLISQALQDGYVPLQVEVPIMDSIAGAGRQQVFLALDWSTLAKTTEKDPSFDQETPSDDDQNNGNGSGSNNGTGNGSGTGNGTGIGSGNGNLNGGGSLSGGGSLNGGSTLGGNTLPGISLGGNSLSGGLTSAGLLSGGNGNTSLGGSSLGGSSLGGSSLGGSSLGGSSLGGSSLTAGSTGNLLSGASSIHTGDLERFEGWLALFGISFMGFGVMLCERMGKEQSKNPKR